MLLIRARTLVVGCVLCGVPVAAAQAQGSSGQARAVFQAFDLNQSGWLSGREVTACDCPAYDGDRNGEITWEEFRAGYARAPLFGGDRKRPAGPGATQAAPARAAAPPRAPAAAPSPAAAPAPPSANTPYRVGQEVEVKVGGSWHPATIVNIQNGRYALSRHDRSLGVTTDNEWIGAENLRPFVARLRAPTPTNAPMPAAVPSGDYDCMTYGTSQSIGKLRMLGNGVSSGVTRDGSGPQHRFTFDSSNGTLHWVGGLTIAGWTVESAEYRPEFSGRPNINLHYRRQAGGNLNSMSCTRH
jgi:hypothetical protein